MSFSDEEITRAMALQAQYGTLAEAARMSGLSERSFRRRLSAATAMGLAPGIKGTTPIGMAVTNTKTLYNSEGAEVLQWVGRERDRSAVDVAAVMMEAFAEFPGQAKPVKRPAIVRADLASLTALGDLHIGMYAWEGDGGNNWDLKLGESVIGECVDEVVAGTPASGLAIVLIGGDYFHADNKENKTRKSGNVLDVDGRFDKVIEVGTRMAVRTIDRHLAKHDHVLARVLKGNHDENAAVALCWFLKAWYRNEPRVTIDTDASLFWFYRFGLVQLGSTHGHECKINDLPQVMASRRSEDWGATKFRYCHGFHLHHKSRGGEVGGCTWEVHRTPIPQDGWHFGKGFLSGRALESITYHREAGEYGRTTRNVLDNVVMPAKAANDNFKHKKGCQSGDFGPCDCKRKAA